MARTFNGQIHVRVPTSTHAEVAREAFEKGTRDFRTGANRPPGPQEH